MSNHSHLYIQGTNQKRLHKHPPRYQKEVTNRSHFSNNRFSDTDDWIEKGLGKQPLLSETNCEQNRYEQLQESNG